MAVAFDAATASSSFVTPSTTFSLSHTVTGANPTLYFAFATFSATDIVTAVTYNSVAMTRVQAAIGDGIYGSTYMYVLPNPATGAHTVSVTTSGATLFDGSAASYTGTNTTQPDGSAKSTIASAPGAVDTPANVTTTISGDWGGLFVVCGRQVNAGTGSTRRTLSSNTQSAWLDTNSAFGSTGSNFINYQTNASSGGPLTAIVVGIAAPAAVVTVKQLAALGAG